MKIKVGTFNCENLFSRYRFFYVKRGRKKGNIYNKKYLSVSDIPTTLVESFVKDSVLETLYEYPGFLPKEVISRKDGNKVTKSNLQTLAKNGKSRLFDFKIPSITKIYPKVTKKNVGNKDQNLKKLLDYRVVALQVQKEMDEIEMEGGLLNSAERNLSYKGFAKNQRWNTAKVILANDPDILALQEIENLDTLKAFNKKYLYPRNLKRELQKEYNSLNSKFRGTYPFGALIDSNDPRLIDVAILSRYPIISVKTHQFERFKSGNRWTSIFSRDCLEVKIAVTDKAGKSLRSDYKGKILTYPISERIISPSKIGKTITIFANHFKSKLGQPDTNPEKSKSWKKRKLQSERTAEILYERFGKKLSGNFVVAGDLNDSPDSGALKPLLDTGIWNIVEKSSEPWTHYYDKTDHAEQFDYLLLSKDLKKKNSSRKPIIERRGLAINKKSKIKLINSGPRFKTVDKPNTESSDHAAIFVNLTI